ncbi:MAG: hypothetical protein ACE5EX_00545 [Phycisphaerae bacterium]
MGVWPFILAFGAAALGALVCLKLVAVEIAATRDALARHERQQEQDYNNKGHGEGKKSDARPAA